MRNQPFYNWQKRNKQTNIVLLFILKSLKSADAEVMIYLPNDDSGDCATAKDCQRKCRSLPEGCTAPIETELVMKEGIWSTDRKNNPFAKYFKVRN